MFSALRRASTNGALYRPSSVIWSLWGEKPPELPPPDGVSSPVTSHRLLWESKSMSPATWQHAPRSLETRMIFCSLARSSDGLGPSTNLNRDSWKYPTYGSHALSDAALSGASVFGVVIVLVVPSDCLTLVTVCGA